MENGSPSPRADAFPAGLRVLVVDDDPTWLKILEKMLKKCSYEVTTCCLARAALDMLRERKDRFDIVVSDVNMPDMDGFKLLEQVGLEMDLPVIMMSVDGETSRVMRGVQHGACDYLLKPVRMKELRNIWQHVFRRKRHEVKDLESHESNEDAHAVRNGIEETDDGLLLVGSDTNSTRKRKVTENDEHDDQDLNDHASVKKTRVVWSVDLHQKFVNVVNQIGFDKVGPKKVLDLMNVPGLRRENVASHLQKYRLYLSRLQKQNEPNSSFCGIKHSDFNSKDTPSKFALQSSITTHQNNPINSFGYSEKKTYVQAVGVEIPENDFKSIACFLPGTEVKKSLPGEAVDISEVKDIPQVRKVMEQNSEFMSFSQTWSGEVSARQDNDYTLLEEGYSNMQMPSQPYKIQVDHQQKGAPSIDARNTGRSKMDLSTKPTYTECGSGQVRNISLKAANLDSLSFQIEPVSISGGLQGIKDDVNCRHGIGGWDSYQDFTLRNGLLLAAPHEDLQLYSLHGNGYFGSFGVNNMEFLDYCDSTSFTELPSQIYDELRLNFDYPCEVVEYPLVDESLFIL
ncbi:two-component response regulator ORR26-like [Aristolochia californica]|uniref:two-component response regulator ORR26-like n=1 Tax=Aristolochia californica TaxID=171875 RepID=UPI0035E1E5E4